MGIYFTVKSRRACKVCGQSLPTVRHRAYCSKQCRTKFYNKKNYKRIQQWQTDNRAKYAPGKIRCLECGRWYFQVCSHVYWKHGIIGRDYRKLHGLDVKRGILPDFLRELKASQVFENGTVKNLKAGKKNWFKKGQKGVGVYQRSEQTMARLKKLNKFNKHNKYAETRVSNRIR